ncbi:MAG: hypothetical protein Q4A84_09330 [Neisseria sp.]|uniref:hypothetical protein n=1 Tax=Neisseria sp. TaxID=192066 RepID=UPI0026DBC513|nr:hypothetical protein [Neisseria sp.]MDO4641879.1 hypothetical protein [Neisseria sp.]
MDVGYKAQNCSYIINSLEGASTEPYKRIQTKILQIGEFKYETIVYLDAMQDEDYFGKGVCHWKPEGFGFALKATGKPEETEFNFGDFLNELQERKTLTKYYWKGGYPYFKNDDGSRYNDDDVVSYGADSPTKYSTDRQGNLFSMTVTLEEMKQS